jgi:uncharacterized protein (DUF952 family)
MASEKTNLIYKVVTADQWAAAEQEGEFRGAAIDLQDGYIHFSTATQVRETVSKHFAGQLDLLLVGIDPVKLGDALRWEPSRGGALFPHLYANLSLADVVSVNELPIGKDGLHLFPEEW